MKRYAIAALVIVSTTVVFSGCSGPPPALPTAVLEQGVDALSEEHPEMPQEQLVQCSECHRASDAPAQ